MGQLPYKLHQATFKIAALSFWGLSSIVLISDYVGLAPVNYPVAWALWACALVAGLACWFVPFERLAAGWFWIVIAGGMTILNLSLYATGGLLTHIQPLFLVVVVFAAALLEFRTAAVVTVVAVASLLVPLAFGWDAHYARIALVTIACAVIGLYVPALVRRALTEENQLAEKRQRELEESYLSTIEALAAALDAKDRHTEDHSRETAALARAVGRRLGLADEKLRFLEYAALLHDIGKIGIPGYVLNKPGPLDAEEMAIMREHPVIGERIVASVPFLAQIRPIVRAEHERWDGKGYPDGLLGDDIPVEARIIHACDAFQAMSSERPYRKALPRDRILDELRSQSGKQFDPSVAAALLQVIESGEIQVAGTSTPAQAEDHPVELDHPWTRHLDAIQSLGARLATVNTVPEVCRMIGDTIITLVPYDQCRIYLLEDDGIQLWPVFWNDTSRPAYSGVTAESLQLKVGEGITGWVAETKRGVVIGDTEHHPKAVHVPGTSDEDESMMAVPVIFEDNLVGVIVVVKLGLHQFSQDQLRLLTILANQAAVSIANARLIERLAASATTDPLTGLSNRRAFEGQLKDRLKGGAGFSLLMLDVDGLKQVNDAGGHGAGDAVLRRVAQVVRENVREQDQVTRWGGDEFIVLMPEVDRVGAVSLARRISSTLSQSAPPEGPISVSIGFASFPGDGETADILLAAADRSMYAEKRQRAA
jgi:diguanylate cyclase (GGDEF)-like protein/putative nucleotidyltransferase with HDIG domain